MIEILHIVRQLSCGDIASTLVGEAKYSSLLGDFQHRVVSLLPAESIGASVAGAAGVNVLSAPDRSTILREMERADIVQVDWWNNPELGEVLRSELPAARLLIRLHVAGDKAPQVITPELMEFADYSLANNPCTCELPVFQDLLPHVRYWKTGMIYGGPEFDHLLYLKPKPHKGFNVGYISVGDHVQMHPRYVAMSASMNIPGMRFVVHAGRNGNSLREQLRQSSSADCFELHSPVDDLRPVLEILDVYGYPVSEETYAVTEHKLQDVMAAGIPAVVFPHGGLKHLVVNEYTGLVVQSELEYTQAIEHLYHDQEERIRLGRNAREYARQQFGAGNAAKKLNSVYERLMESPKRKRIWGTSAGADAGWQRLSFRNLFECPEKLTGAQMFTDSLGEEGRHFVKSMTSRNDEELFDADRRIAACSALMRSAFSGGIMSYRDHYPTDAYLRFWAGLVLQQEGDHGPAASEMAEAARLGFSHWRVYWYLAQLAEKEGDRSFARESLDKVLQAVPNFGEAQEMLKRLGNSEDRQGEPRSLRSTSHGLNGGAPRQYPEVAMSPLIPDDTRDSLASLAYQKIQPLIESGNQLEAIEAMEKLIEWYPGFALGHNQLGVLHFDRRDQKKALAHYEEAVRLEPENITFLKNLADFYYVVDGRIEEALQLYVRTLSANPEDVEALLVVGRICEALGRFDDARNFYTRILEIEPWNEEARNSLDKVLDQQLQASSPNLVERTGKTVPA